MLKIDFMSTLFVGIDVSSKSNVVYAMDFYKKLHRAISREKHHIFRSFNQWRTAILSAFGYDPLKCECGAAMLFLELYFNHKRVSLEELYEKAMSRSRGRRSSA